MCLRERFALSIILALQIKKLTARKDIIGWDKGIFPRPNSGFDFYSIPQISELPLAHKKYSQIAYPAPSIDYATSSSSAKAMLKGEPEW